MRFGFTEYDAALSNVWKLQVMENTATVVQSRIGCGEVFINDLKNLVKRNIIYHGIFSGFENSPFEPTVPDWGIKMEALHTIASNMPDRRRVVLRLNPVIPTKPAMTSLAEILDAAPHGIRVRMDFLKLSGKIMRDIEELRLRGYPLLLHWNTFEVPLDRRKMVMDFFHKRWGRKFSVLDFCQSPLMPADHCAGCISRDDYRILQLPDDFSGDYEGGPHCSCVRSKVPLYDKEAIVECMWNGNLQL